VIRSILVTKLATDCLRVSQSLDVILIAITSKLIKIWLWQTNVLVKLVCSAVLQILFTLH